jgi:RimJ/RimL family protein N-acetyltransferase
VIVTDKSLLIPWVNSKAGFVGDFHKVALLGWVDTAGVRAVFLFNRYDPPAVDVHVFSDGTRRWLAKELLHAVFNSAFVQLGCTRITAPVRESNVQARRCLEKAGFSIDGILKKYYDTGEARILYGLLREECKYAYPTV